MLIPNSRFNELLKRYNVRSKVAIDAIVGRSWGPSANTTSKNRSDVYGIGTSDEQHQFLIISALPELTADQTSHELKSTADQGLFWRLSMDGCDEVGGNGRGEDLFSDPVAVVKPGYKVLLWPQPWRFPYLCEAGRNRFTRFNCLG